MNMDMIIGDGKRQEIIDAGTIKNIEKDGAISAGESGGSGGTSVEYGLQMPADFAIPANTTYLYVMSPVNGELDNYDRKITSSDYYNTPTFIVAGPLKKFSYAAIAPTGAKVYFTPAADYDGFYGSMHSSDKLPETGTVEPGDNCVYLASINYNGDTVTITKTSAVARSAEI